MAVTEYCPQCGQYHVQTSAGCPNFNYIKTSDGCEPFHLQIESDDEEKKLCPIIGSIEFGPPTFYPKQLNIPYKCPVCEGTGLVSRPPNVAGDQETWTSDSTGPYKCKACNGSGIVWSQNDYF